MPRKTPTTNALRLLDSRGIAYETLLYSPEIHSAQGVAEALGLPVERVFKTLVSLPAAGERPRPLLAIVPGDSELDLKVLAKAAGGKKLRMATQREAEAATGLLVGGISALALLQKHWAVYLDASAHDADWLVVSAGQRGINLRLAVGDLVAATGAVVAPVARRVSE
jgi:Cys-tRNA(Pro)/Cys-tRNA(Cys) deacylase